MLILVKPAHCHRRALRKFVHECKRAGDQKIQGLYVIPRSYGDFMRNHAPHLRFLMNDHAKKILGLCYFSPDIDEETRRVDGDLAYHIAPSERQQGYGVQLLALALEFMREQGAQRVCITCRENNLPSAKIIKANGGVLTEEFEHKGVARQTYWIEL